MGNHRFLSRLIILAGFGLLAESVSAQKAILAKVRLKPGTNVSFYDQTARLVALTRTEEGCLSFNIHHNADSTGVLIMHEIFSNEAAFQQHLKKPYVMAWFKRLDTLKAAPIEVTQLELLK